MFIDTSIFDESCMERIVEKLRDIHLHTVLHEFKIHKVVEEELKNMGLAYKREAVLGKISNRTYRVDFLCEGGVAIEVKRFVQQLSGEEIKRDTDAIVSNFIGVRDE